MYKKSIFDNVERLKQIVDHSYINQFKKINYNFSKINKNKILIENSKVSQSYLKKYVKHVS